jgi:hypothetical protein
MTAALIVLGVVARLAHCGKVDWMLLGYGVGKGYGCPNVTRGSRFGLSLCCSKGCLCINMEEDMAGRHNKQRVKIPNFNVEAQCHLRRWI